MVTDLTAKPAIGNEAPGTRAQPNRGAGLRLSSYFRLSAFASVKLTIAVMVAIATCVLLGAWCPQEAQNGRDKVIETFGPQMAKQLIDLGIADIFHSPLFLGLIGLLTVNMVACSVQRVFPKVRSLRQPMPFLAAPAIARLAVARERECDLPPQVVLGELAARLRRNGYIVHTDGNKLTGHWGKIGRLAATVTHIGLLMLLAGVTITSWTGFSGFQAVPLHGDMLFDASEHSKLWVGHLPHWRVHVDATRRENYASGEAKQWYSNLSVYDQSGRLLKRQEISVNNPLSYDGVDIYQSSWGLGSIAVSFNGKRAELPLRQMSQAVHAAFLPLDRQTIMMFSVHGADEPVRLFAKVPEWRTPRILAALVKGKAIQLGGVEMKYEELVPVTGLQYKCDPGLPLTYTAFGFIIAGVMLAAVPFRQVWACVDSSENGGSILSVGGTSRKAKAAFEKSLARIVETTAAGGSRTRAASAFAGQTKEEEALCRIFS